MKSLKLSKGLELFIGGIGASQAFYLFIYSFLEKNKNHKNILLGLLFLAISIRIIKSLLWAYLETTPGWLINLGFLAHSISGPALLLYVYSFIFDKKWSHRNFLHFIPSVILLLFISSLTLDNFWYIGGYSALLFHQMIYSIAGIIIAVIGLISKKENINVPDKRDQFWIVILIVGTFLLQAAYFTNYILGLTPYLLGPVVYAVFVYFLSFYGLKNPQIFNNKLSFKKYKNINITERQQEHFINKLNRLMDQEKPYLNDHCTLKLIADQINLPAYMVSHIINKTYAQNLPDYINSYRIQEAKKLLNNSEYDKFKIANIAYDCGFSSLSSFNIAFKKHVGLTPSVYRKKSRDL